MQLRRVISPRPVATLAFHGLYSMYGAVPIKQHGEEGLRRKKPIAKSHPNQTPDEIVEKILYLRRKYHLGPIRIMWYMARYHQMRVSDATIYRVLKRHGVNRLPGKVGRRKGPYETVQQASAGPPHSNGRQVPDIQRQGRQENQALSIHRH